MSTLTLFTIFGPRQVTTLGRVISTFIHQAIDILSLSQSVNKDGISITLTCQMNIALPQSSSLDVIHSMLRKQGLQCSYQRIDYQDEIPEQCPILTLLSLGLNDDHLMKVISTLSSMSIYVKQVNTLSNVSNVVFTNKSTFCIEFKLAGCSGKYEQLHSAIKALSHELPLDLVLQADASQRKAYKLAVFDMDSTLIKAEVIDCLAEFAGVSEQVASITKKAMNGELDFNESFKMRMAMLKGVDETVLQGVASKLPLMNGAEKLIRNLKMAGFKTVIISGGFMYFAQYLKNKLGIDKIYANELEIIDGKVTGQVKGRIIDGARKAQLMTQLSDQENLQLSQVIAVGDGANDLPMLKKAGLGIAFNAKPIVQKCAPHVIKEVDLTGILYVLGFLENKVI
ncbi:MAG: phosphoserine phosphatase SerB [Endozoicomonas sp. (ex Botrylloides leachii)]|nr:phosphoserine phosphatase SerB [Endozoicomonas sp. (ex Botrylloides leachii)]